MLESHCLFSLLFSSSLMSPDGGTGNLMAAVDDAAGGEQAMASLPAEFVKLVYDVVSGSASMTRFVSAEIDYLTKLEASHRLLILKLVARCSELTHIDLSFCGLEGSVDMGALCRGLTLNQLKQLNLGWNEGLLSSDEACGELRDAIGRCRHIEVLVLQRTGLTAAGLLIVAQPLKGREHSSLRRLNLASNPLGDEAAECVARLILQITHLDICKTGMHSQGGDVIGTALRGGASIPSLECLRMDATDASMVVSVLKALMFNKSVRELEISDLGVYGLPYVRVLYRLMDLVKANEVKLERFSLKKCHIMSQQWHLLFEALKCNKTITHLSLYKGLNLSSVFPSIMSFVQSNNGTLRNLDLVDTDLGPDQVNDLLGAMETTSMSTDDLESGQVEQGGSMTRFVSAEIDYLTELEASHRLVILKLVAGCSKLTHIDLSFCGLEGLVDMGALCRGLTLDQLKQLNLGWNEGLLSSDEACGELRDAIGRCPVIEELVLERTGLTGAGLLIVAQPLTDMDHSSLRRLNLASNPLGGEAAECVARLILQITHLDICKTGMHSQGGDVIGTALRGGASIPSLECLRMDATDASMVVSVLKALMSNKSVRELEISDLGVYGLPYVRVLYRLMDLVKANEVKLERFSLKKCHIMSQQWHLLFEALKCNKTITHLSLYKGLNLSSVFPSIMSFVQSNNGALRNLDLVDTDLGSDQVNDLLGAMEATSMSTDDLESGQVEQAGSQGVDDDDAAPTMDFGSNSCLGYGGLSLVNALVGSYETMTEFKAGEHKHLVELEAPGRVVVLGLVGVCSKLSHIDLSFCRLRDLLDISALCRGLSLNMVVSHLNLSWNEDLLSSDEACKELGNVITMCLALEVLVLERTGVTASGLQLLLLGQPLLKQENHSLQRLNLGCNPLGYGGAVHVARFLQSTAGLRITHLDISKTEMQTEGGDMVGTALRSAATRLECLRINAADASMCVPVLKAVAVNRSVRELEISDLGVYGLPYVRILYRLIDVVRANEVQLKTLSLKRCHIMGQHWALLFQALECNVTLCHLSLFKGLNLRSAFHSVIRLLKANGNLRSVDLMDTDLEPQQREQVNDLLEPRIKPAEIGLPDLMDTDLEPQQGKQVIDLLEPGVKPAEILEPATSFADSDRSSRTDDGYVITQGNLKDIGQSISSDAEVQSTDVAMKLTRLMDQLGATSPSLPQVQLRVEDMAERDAPQEASAGLAASADSIVASPAPGEIGALDLEQLPQVLRLLIEELTAVPPTIDTVDLGAASHGGDYFVGPSQAARSTSDSVQMWVLGLIASCPSLKVVDLTGCRITKESEVQRLCEGLKRNTVLRRLVLDGNEGFGSDFGCRQVSLILVSTTSLEILCMDSVGMQVTGLSHLVAALVGNTAGSRLKILDLEKNQELGDEGSGELLAQLLSNPSTSKCLKVLGIRGIGLTVAGAAPLSAALLARNTALETFQVGPGRCRAEEEGGPLKIILSSVRCSTLVLTCSNKEKGLAESLAQMLQSANSTLLKVLKVLEGHFSTLEWRCIFRSLATVTTLSYLILEDSAGLDHNVIEDLEQLVGVNSGLRIWNTNGAPLKGSTEEGFYCSCSSCINAASDVSAAAAIKSQDFEQLPRGLREIIVQLTALRPTIHTVMLPRGTDAGDYFGAPKSDSVYWNVRMQVLGLIATCPSLRVLDVRYCRITRKAEVVRLCEGLKSNTVLRQLLLRGNTGFGSEFGCRQVSEILASSSTLEALHMGSVDMEVKGLSQLVAALIGNPAGSRLQVLDLENNKDLGDEGSGELLAQLLSNPCTSKCLRDLRILGIGLTVAGAAALSAALLATQNIVLQRLSVGPGVDSTAQQDGPLKILITSIRCRDLYLKCSKEKGLVEALAQMLRANTTLRYLKLIEAHFSPTEWRAIFEAVPTTLVTLHLEDSSTLDHNLVDDIQKLLAVNPSLFIPDIHGAALKGGSDRSEFYCSCPSCDSASGESNDVAMKLTRLMDELGSTSPSITHINEEDLDFITQPCRRRVLELVGTCSSVKSITLPPAFISGSDFDDVNTLCAGLASSAVLEELILYNNFGFGTKYGCHQLAKVIFGCTRTLQHLRLKRVGMNSVGLAYLTQALQQTFMATETASVLGILDLSDNSDLGDAGAELIAQLLRSPMCSALVFLDIRNIGMGVTGAHSLSVALQHNTSLVKLIVGEEREAREEGNAEAPVDVLLGGLIRHPSSAANQSSGAPGPCNNRTLTMLQVYKARSSEILAQVLETNTTLTTLELEDCMWSHEDWTRIFKALSGNEVLRVLDLNRVNVELEPVFRDLLELLQLNTTLEEIKLDKTDLGRKGKVPVVEEALRRNKQQAEYLTVLKDKLPLVRPSTGRLFLCGSPYAGKSTLRESMVRWYRGGKTVSKVSAARALLLCQHGFDSDKARTKGIEIEVLRDDKEMQISIWDMAGQEQYHAMHGHLFPNTNQACMFIFAYNPLHKGSNNNSDVLDEDDFGKQLLYWLRFIASNSRSTGYCLPSVTVVITHLDKLPSTYNVNVVATWAEDTVVARLRHQFAEVVEICNEIFVVNACLIASVKRILDLHVFHRFEQLLQHKLPLVIDACAQMSLALATRTLQPNIEPVVRADEFFKLCAEKVEALRDLFKEDHGAATGPVVAAYATKVKHAVADYLHDVGSIVHFRDLDFIVVNPNWLAKFLSKFIRLGPALPSDGILPATTDGFIDGFVLEHSLRVFIKQSLPICSGLETCDLLPLLLQLLVKLDLCYKEEVSTSESPSRQRVRYFVPSSLGDQTEVPLARIGERTRMFFCCFGARSARSQTMIPLLRSANLGGQLKWQVRVEDEATCTHIGKRLECDDAKRTLLTPGLFPRLQVSLRRVLNETHKLEVSSGQYSIEYNLIRILLNGCEILVESSGDNGTFMDILVRAEKMSRAETSELVHRLIVKEIQAFCATPQGCPGIMLMECIIRPECVRELSSCLDRKGQAIRVESLKKKLMEDFLSKTKSVNKQGGIKDGGEDGRDIFLDEGLTYKHYWPELPNSRLGKAFNMAIDLLDTHDLVDILDRERASLERVANEIGKAVKEVTQVQESQEGEIMGLTASSGEQEMGDPGHLFDRAISERSWMDRRFNEQKELLLKMDKKLDEHKDFLLSSVPSLVKELKIRERQMQGALTRGVDDVMSFMRDLQNTQMLRFPYFSYRDVGNYQRFVAFFRIGSALKLHFMCEDRSGMHFVENQEGYDVRIEPPEYETMRCIALQSAKLLYILVKAGLQIGAGHGGIVPEFTSCAGEILPITSQFMGTILNDIKLNDQYSASKQEDATRYLQGVLKGERISSIFQLYRVEYLHPSVGGKSARFAWVCEKCMNTGVDNQTLKECF